MNKIYGLLSDFALIYEDASRWILCYGLTPEEDGVHATWYEIYFYKKQEGKPSIDRIKEAIRGDINSRTDAAILTGFSWTPEGGSPISVWLSEENQRNFSEAQRLAAVMPEAMLPITFKLGEDANGDPVYHEFSTSEELTVFYMQAVAYVNAQLQAGWQEKDGIDWSAYESALNPPKKRK